MFLGLWKPGTSLPGFASHVLSKPQRAAPPLHPQRRRHGLGGQRNLPAPGSRRCAELNGATRRSSHQQIVSVTDHSSPAHGKKHATPRVEKKNAARLHLPEGVPREARPRGARKVSEGWDGHCGFTGAGAVGVEAARSRIKRTPTKPSRAALEGRAVSVSVSVSYRTAYLPHLLVRPPDWPRTP